MNLFRIRNAAQRLQTMAHVALEAASQGDVTKLNELQSVDFSALATELDYLLADTRSHVSEDKMLRSVGLTPAEADARLKAGR